MRLIDADEMSRIFAHYGDGAHMYDAYDLDDMLDKMPTIDPVKHGKWLPYEFGDWKWHKCSVCGVADEYGREIRREFTGFKEERLFARHDFCPHCGAKMENPREEVKK